MNRKRTTVSTKRSTAMVEAVNHESQSNMARVVAAGWESVEFDSSNVIAARYMPSEAVLQLTFKSGSYQYNAVPVELWEEFKAAKSKGEFVNIKLTGPDRGNPLYKGVKLL